MTRPSEEPHAYVDTVRALERNARGYPGTLHSPRACRRSRTGACVCARYPAGNTLCLSLQYTLHQPWAYVPLGARQYFMFILANNGTAADNATITMSSPPQTTWDLIFASYPGLVFDDEKLTSTGPLRSGQVIYFSFTAQVSEVDAFRFPVVEHYGISPRR